MKFLYSLFCVVLLTVSVQSATLADLAVRNCESFNEYSSRLKMVADSIAAVDAQIQKVTNTVVSSLPPLEPKGEFEKLADYESRKADYDAFVKSKVEGQIAGYLMYKNECEVIYKKIVEIQSQVLADAMASGNGNVSPFSAEGEIDLDVLLKPTSKHVDEYERRIQIIEERIENTDKEREILLTRFLDSYPRLNPKEDLETEQEFVARRTVWQQTGDSLYSSLLKRCDAYRERLVLGISKLEGFINEVRSLHLWTYAKDASVVLGNYDSEKEAFELNVLDTLNPEVPFAYAGWLYMPIDKAKDFDRTLTGFDVRVEFFNDPLHTDHGDLYAGVIKMDLTHPSFEFDYCGKFMILDYSHEEGFEQWKKRIKKMRKNLK